MALIVNVPENKEIDTYNDSDITTKYDIPTKESEEEINAGG